MTSQSFLVSIAAWWWSSNVVSGNNIACSGCNARVLAPGIMARHIGIPDTQFPRGGRTSPRPTSFMLRMIVVASHPFVFQSTIVEDLAMPTWANLSARSSTRRPGVLFPPSFPYILLTPSLHLFSGDHAASSSTVMPKSMVVSTRHSPLALYIDTSNRCRTNSSPTPCWPNSVSTKNTWSDVPLSCANLMSFHWPAGIGRRWEV
jgi:hypothetical protein